MNTILFYHRCELTDLYIALTRHLNEHFKILHVAFSDVEAKKLEKAGIKDFISYQQLFYDFVDNNKVEQTIIEEIDTLIIERSSGRFNLNASIQSDRGFSVLSYDEALLLAQSHYLTWKTIFEQNKVDLMYHESCSQFLVHIAALLCKGQGGIYRDVSQCRSDEEGYHFINIDGENYNCDEIYKKYKHFIEYPETIDRGRVISFIKDFRNDYSVFLGENINLNIPLLHLYLQGIKKSIFSKLYAKRYDKLKNNIEFWLNHSNIPFEKIHNLNQYKKLNIKFETNIPQGETYYYYSFHLEPEATVLYLGDGIYANQVKLIENIASSLPAGSYLYVKDHPHEYAYRRAEDYERLMKVPNIRLFHQSIPGKALIAGSKGVFSINGTAGFEALLLNKQVYCFGNCYYAINPRVNVINNIRDIRSIVYSLKDVVYKDDDSLIAFVNAYLTSSHKGYTDYFCGRATKLGIDDDENARIIGKDIIEEFKQNN